MSQNRVARGWSTPGQQRLRRCLLAVLVAGIPALIVAPASGSSGGASAGSGGSTPAGNAPHSGTSAPQQPASRAVGASPLSGRAMWIWYVSASNGGSLASIVGTAHRYGVSFVIVKSGDGSTAWSQFNPQLVSTLHANGLRVCAWQYVYGNHPIFEAQVGAAAATDGADCLVIDAESEYEGKYVQAQTYITQLRKLLGASYPVALAGFPYVDYHPAFPYSVFLGPGGAQYNAPQMYWLDIGTTVDAVYTHTYSFNRVYQRQIDPLGQVWENPPASQIIRFRQLSRAYGAPGVSWWDWQEASTKGWHAISRPTASLGGPTAGGPSATIKRGWHGDLVVWAQQHLITAGYAVKVDGGFGSQMVSAVRSFQRTHGLSVDGVIGPATWQALLRYPAASVRWTATGATTITTTTNTVRAASAGGVLIMPVPKSASLPARRDEIAGAGGAG
jgi:Putative peptidoglycan binding domain